MGTENSINKNSFLNTCKSDTKIDVNHKHDNHDHKHDHHDQEHDHDNDHHHDHDDHDHDHHHHSHGTPEPRMSKHNHKKTFTCCTRQQLARQKEGAKEQQDGKTHGRHERTDGLPAGVTLVPAEVDRHTMRRYLQTSTPLTDRDLE